MVLNSDRRTRKKALADRQGCRSGERLVEQPWLQLMYCALVSIREVGHVFQSEGSRQDRSPKWQVVI